MSVSTLLADPVTWAIIIGSYGLATAFVAVIQHLKVKNAPKRTLPQWASARYPRRSGDAAGSGSR
jgi:hypothetical protein